MKKYTDIFDIEQKFCKKCAGLKQMKYEGKVIPPEKWWDVYPGMANDIGCICKNPHLSKEN